MDWVNKLNDRAQSWQQVKSPITNTSTTATATTTVVTNVMTTSGSSSMVSSSSYDESVQSEVDGEDPMIGQIFGYWFHNVEGPDTVLGDEHREFWFVRNKVVDSLIRNNFKAIWEKAIAGECDHWVKTIRGLVCLVILLDQFSRNMYRDTPKMYMGDKKCQEIVEKAIADGIPQKLPIYQAIWFGFPLTRIEDRTAIPKIQNWYGLIKERVKGTKFETYVIRGTLYATNQVDLLSRFGRYPNRNAVLERPNTPEEEEYLNSDKKYYST